MGMFKSFFEKKRREPLGRGYGVSGSGEINETGGKTYKAMIEKEKHKRRKEKLMNLAKKIENHAVKMAEQQEQTGGIMGNPKRRKS